MKNTLLFILLLAALSFSACEKEKTPPTELEKLPAATQEGKNTFGCLVDGKAWTPKWGGLLKPELTPMYNEIIGQFALTAYQYQNDSRESISLGTKPQGVFAPGEVITRDSNFVYVSKKDPCSSSSQSFYWSKSGTIQITRLDVSTGIISGTFEFDAVSETCQDTVRITDGRFDIKYK
ncbi:MAG: hypothetical protein J0L99_05170 [Chitinophagales bacterium]|nr:hypothetical protein [Chitinophagales bacterium]